MNTVISINQLAKSFGSTVAVDGIDLEISKGEIFAFLGPNGAGKSTTLRMICGLCKPTSGSVSINNTDIFLQKDEYKQKLGLVSQHFNVDSELTVYENLKIHAFLYNMNTKVMDQKIPEMLALSDLTEKKDTLVSKLSGGMKRKLQIARAILHDPQIIFLDEPTVGLDAFSRAKIWNMIKKLSSEGKTIFFTTHYIEEAENYAEQVSIIHKGKIIKTDSPREMIQNLGEWCRESFYNDKTYRKYFHTKEEALNYDKDSYKKLTIRHTQLEDVFIELTGEEELS